MMDKVKKATVTAFTATVKCPYCAEAVEEPRSGSEVWSLIELAAGAEFDCQNCGERLAIPSRIKGADLRA